MKGTFTQFQDWFPNYDPAQNQTLYIYIGCFSGFNGGAFGDRDGGYGGGASDIRLIPCDGGWSGTQCFTPVSLDSRLLVAGGGGGAGRREGSIGGNGNYPSGSVGSEPSGCDKYLKNAGGGTNSAGGSGGECKLKNGLVANDIMISSPGSYANGGAATFRKNNGGGGAGGYYGGGGGVHGKY